MGWSLTDERGEALVDIEVLLQSGAVQQIRHCCQHISILSWIKSRRQAVKRDFEFSCGHLIAASGRHVSKSEYI